MTNLNINKNLHFCCSGRQVGPCLQKNKTQPLLRIETQEKNVKNGALELETRSFEMFLKP